MKTITHIFRKDWTRLQFLMLPWLAILLLQVVLNSSFFVESFVAQVKMPSNIGSVLIFIKGLLSVVMIVLLIHDDTLVGTSAFWLTRPIARRDLFLSKMIFLLGLFVLLPVVSEASILLVNGYHLKYFLLAFVDILIQLGGWLIPQDFECPNCGYTGYAYLEVTPTSNVDGQREPASNEN